MVKLLFRNFESFIKNKVLAKKGDKRNEKSKCYKYKGFRHEKWCLNLINEEENDKKEENEKEKKGKGAKILNVTLENYDEDDRRISREILLHC